MLEILTDKGVRSNYRPIPKLGSQLNQDSGILPGLWDIMAKGTDKSNANFLVSYPLLK